VTNDSWQDHAGADQKLILVIDDDAHMRLALRACLEHGGYRVAEAASGAQALEQLSGALPALIVLDLTMPGMDGAAFVIALRRHGLHSAIPILILSANDDVARVAKELGLRNYLGKPLRVPALLQAVTQLMPA
jgi:CheY-like chemotaxis protein